MKSICIIVLLLLFSAVVEPVENIVTREDGKQFPCLPGETTMHCTVRALHTIFFDEPDGVMRFV